MQIILVRFVMAEHLSDEAAVAEHLSDEAAVAVHISAEIEGEEDAGGVW